MAKSAAEPAPSPEPRGYFAWSRDPAVGLFAVLPLWIVYEVLRFSLAPADRNGAERMLMRGLERFGERGHLALTLSFGLLLFLAARSLVKRHVPWARVTGVIVLEGTVYALMLGPLASALARSVAGMLAAGPMFDAGLAGNLIGSLGAGIFEELVFRLGLMTALVWVGAKALPAWELPRWAAGVFAVLVSALVFSWFHHLCGEPWDGRVFLFRTMAGLLLGLLMWGRGYGVCVYTHSIYNLWFYLGDDHGSFTR